METTRVKAMPEQECRSQGPKMPFRSTGRMDAFEKTIIL